MSILVILLKILSTTVPLLLAVAFFTVAERKIMGAIQRRRGPNVIGFLGLLQAIADGLKLLVKETILPSNSNLGIFLLAPVLSFILSVKNNDHPPKWGSVGLRINSTISSIQYNTVHIVNSDKM